jgi:protoporphyrinogen/coproporphyrinogen III oxidase
VDAVSRETFEYAVLRVVPRVERRPILACTWSSVKFPDRAPEGKVLLRVFFGGEGYRADDDDERLVQTSLSELYALMGIRTAPELIRVRRYRDAMPSYLVGHRARVARIDGFVARHPGLELAGNAYDGVGIPDAIRRGELAADRVVERLYARSSCTDGRVGSHV